MSDQLESGDIVLCQGCGRRIRAQTDWIRQLPKPVRLADLACPHCRSVGLVKLHEKDDPAARSSAAEPSSHLGAAARCTVCGHPAIPGDDVCLLHAG